MLQHIHSLVQLSSCLYENIWQSWEKNSWDSREKIFDSSEGRIKRNWLGQCNVSLVTACGGILDDTHRSWSGSIHCTIYMCVRYKHCVRTQIIIILFSLYIHDRNKSTHRIYRCCYISITLTEKCKWNLIPYSLTWSHIHNFMIKPLQMLYLNIPIYDSFQWHMSESIHYFLCLLFNLNLTIQFFINSIISNDYEMWLL